MRAQISVEKGQSRTYSYANIVGEKRRLTDNMTRRSRVTNPPWTHQPVFAPPTYLHLGRIGLILKQDDRFVGRELPPSNRDNLSPPTFFPVQHGKGFFAVQSGCLREKSSENSCLRSGWLLSPDLEVEQGFTMPKADLLFTPEKFSCFSCGCGCYTAEYFQAVADKVFVHIVGFPLDLRQRGLYQLDIAADGSSDWVQLLPGRIEPPIAISPSGCRIAYFKVSRFGDGLELRDICKTDRSLHDLCMQSN
jgi:hypothetical protein